MKNIIYILFGVLYIVNSRAYAQHPTSDPHYQLVWSDEFSGNVLDTSKWTAYDWRDHGSNLGHTDPNDLPSVSLSQNVEVSGGTVKLHLKKETAVCSDNQWNSEPDKLLYHNNLTSPHYCVWQNATGIPYSFTSAEIRSNRPYQGGYGYFEARCNMSIEKGVWNSFWTFIDWGEVGNAGEIDIFETLGHLNAENDKLLKTNIHLAFCDGGPDGGFQDNGINSSCNYFASGNLCPGIVAYDQNVCATSSIEQWHIYGLELTPDRITWYIDGVIVRTMLNVGVHTNLWIELGIVAQKGLGYSSTNNSLDAVHEIDYFRFYKLESNYCKEAQPLNQCSFSMPGYWAQQYNSPQVYKSVTIGGQGCNNSVPTDGTPYVIRAHDFVEISGDYSVPLGAELFIDVNSCY